MSDERGFGSISGRPGKELVAVDTERSTGEPMTRAHGGARYRVTIPEQMRLVEDLDKRLN